MRKKKIIIGNWKMNPLSAKEAAKIFIPIKKTAGRLKKTETIVCPPFIYLKNFSEQKGKCLIGAQDVFWKDNGSFTGEISPLMLKSLPVSHVIIGHSERRALGENNEVVSKKISAAISAGLKMILCVGEKERPDEASHLNFVANQVKESLKGVSAKSAGNIIIAYEPVWAIGDGSKGPASPEDALEMSIFIKKVLTEIFGKKKADAVPILYGGSVDPGNAREFLEKGAMDGLLVGRESLNPKGFSDILRIAENV